MKCSAPVHNETMIGYRANGSTERRCHRSATVLLPGAFGERWFCYQHAEIWREHNRIVARIREIPVSSRKTRQTKAEKTQRLLVTGRLRVYRVVPDEIAAECRGDSGELYRLGWKDGRWTCSCAARTDCSHLNALWAVTAVAR